LADIDRSLPLVERLRAVGVNVLEHALEPHTISLMRLVIAAAERFPGRVAATSGKAVRFELDLYACKAPTRREWRKRKMQKAGSDHSTLAAIP
jgi:hypothetical protein